MIGSDWIETKRPSGKVPTLRQQLVTRPLERAYAISGQKKGSALVVAIVLGLIPTRKNEHILVLLPKAEAKEPKMTERHLEEEAKGKAKMAKTADALKQEQSPLPSPLGVHHPRARKTGSLAGITLWDPALRALNATTGIHQYAGIGARALALMTKSAHSSTKKNLSRSARRKLRRQHKLSRNLQLKPKLGSERLSFKLTVLALLLKFPSQILLTPLVAQ